MLDYRYKSPIEASLLYSDEWAIVPCLHFVRLTHSQTGVLHHARSGSHPPGTLIVRIRYLKMLLRQMLIVRKRICDRIQERLTSDCACDKMQLHSETDMVGSTI